MNTQYIIDIKINMPDSGRHARKLINLYFSDMQEDLNETAFHLCDNDGAVQARKFAKITMKRADVWTTAEGHLKIFALLSVSGEEPEFIKQVFAAFMDGFPDCLKKAGARYFSPSGFPDDISLQPTDWNLEVKPK